MNGCETGTGGSAPTTDDYFPGVWLKLGARGVLATDAPVWRCSTSCFMTSFLKGLKEGGFAARTVRSLRANFLAHNNPTGLLYGYYGNPAVRLTVQ
jgi:hypothetical protein